VIDITKLQESDKKRRVIFTDNNKNEEGTITSWNDTFIFVDYNGDGRGHATKPDQLKFTLE